MRRALVLPRGLVNLCDNRRVLGVSCEKYRNHAQAIQACDFLVAVTATLQVVYVFVIMEVGRGRIRHSNVTAHPTAEWTLKQFRDAISGEEPYRDLIHDRESIHSPEFDSALKAMGLRILKTPFRAPQANAYCERLAGSIRRECLDFLPITRLKCGIAVAHEPVDAYCWRSGCQNENPESYLRLSVAGI